MNEISNNVRVVPFDARPIFSVYEEIVQYYQLATPELVLSWYDVKVKEKVKELEATYPLIEQGYPWGNPLCVGENELLLMSDYLGMRPVLTGSELIDVLEIHHMMYIRDGEYRNMPFKGVW